MRQKNQPLSRIFTIVSAIAALFVATEGVFQAFGRSICAAEGCKLVARYARYGDISIILFGFLLFSALTVLSIMSRRASWSLSDGAINLVLVVSLASEGFFTGYQAFRLHTPCVFCLIVFSFIVVLAVIRLLEGERSISMGFASLVAVFCLFYLVLPVGSTASIPNGSPLVLFYGQDCKYCAEVRKVLDEKKVPVKHVLVNEYSGTLKNLGIEHVPTLYVNNQNEKMFVTGKDAILSYLNCRDQKTSVAAPSVKKRDRQTKDRQTPPPAPTGGFNPFEIKSPEGATFQLVLPPTEEGVCRTDENCK